MRKVLVGAAGGIEAGVCVVMDRKDGVNGNVTSYNAIDAAHQQCRVGDGSVDIEVRHHHASVDTSVGAPGTGDGHRVAQYCGHGLLDGLLHTVVVGLYLPSVEACSTIAQSHEVTHCFFNL